MNGSRAKQLRRAAKLIAAPVPERTEAVYKRLKEKLKNEGRKTGQDRRLRDIQVSRGT
jgi:hypothetical protein